MQLHAAPTSQPLGSRTFSWSQKTPTTAAADPQAGRAGQDGAGGAKELLTAVAAISGHAAAVFVQLLRRPASREQLGHDEMWRTNASERWTGSTERWARSD